MLRFVRSWSAISRSLPQFAPARRPHARRRLMRPTLMALEDRRLLSTIVVNNPTDTPVAGQTDLRQAIGQANSNGGVETITFDKTVFKTPQTITLNGTQLELSDTTGTETIKGPKAGVTVNGGGNSRVFLVDPNVTASISGMTITGGNAGSGDGGGLDNSGTLTVGNSTFTDNSAASDGGGLFNDGTLTVSNSTFTSNAAAESDGGGIFNSGTLTVSGSTFTGNSADTNGGGIYNNPIGTATVSGNTFTGNIRRLVAAASPTRYRDSEQQHIHQQRLRRTAAAASSTTVPRR